MSASFLCVVRGNCDYLDILDAISESLGYLESYCYNSENIVPGFRSSNGVSFTDLARQISTFSGGQIDYIYSYVYLNNVAKDKSSLIDKYTYQSRQANLQLTEINTNINDLQDAIDNYQFSITKVPAPDGTSWTEIKVKDDEYNALVNRLTALNAQKTALEERIAILTDRIAKLGGADATDEQKANAETYVTDALDVAKNIYSLVKENAKELFASNAYQNKFMHFVVTSDTEKFSDNIKLFLIGAGAGLGLGLVLWIADAFIIEFKEVKRVNDLREGQ